MFLLITFPFLKHMTMCSNNRQSLLNCVINCQYLLPHFPEYAISRLTAGYWWENTACLISYLMPEVDVEMLLFSDKRCLLLAVAALIPSIRLDASPRVEELNDKYPLLRLLSWNRADVMETYHCICMNGLKQIQDKVSHTHQLRCKIRKSMKHTNMYLEKLPLNFILSGGRLNIWD